jgi:hypothetical protein
MIDVLRDIQAKLRHGAYKNEEHVRLNLVARLLQELGWNIWDPTEVNAEWRVAPTEDATKVDLALFVNSDVPSVFIEIKAIGQLYSDLEDVEKQCRDYNRDNTALFSVITDGQQWRFYYSQTGGQFAQKCFKIVDLKSGDLVEAERSLKAFLSKTEIDIGNAKAEAEKYLQLSQRQRAMEDCLPIARRKISEPPYPSLPECLIALVEERGYIITRDEAISYISTADTVISDPDLNPPVVRPVVVPGTVRTLFPDNPGDLKGTRVLEGRLGSASATRWNELVAASVRLALNHYGIGFSMLQGNLVANLEQGNVGDRGFALIPGTNVSIQGMDANRCARNLVILARMLKCPLRVKVRWGGDSPFAGQEGLLEWEP